jgi:hypothetical protein
MLDGWRADFGVLTLRTSTVLPAVRAVETSPPRRPSAVIVPSDTVSRLVLNQASLA